MRSATERRPVLFAENRPTSTSPMMTRAGAMRHGSRNMPADLKRAGFQVEVFASDQETHGGTWFRISYWKRV